MPIEAVAVAASGLMPTRQLDKAELRDAVRQAIASLGERQRMAVLLSKFEHFSYAEIAEIMELTPEAVKSLLSRARTRLREVLEPYFERGTPVATTTDHRPPTPDTSTSDILDLPCRRSPPQSETPDTDELVAYLDGELSADECRRVERRLASDAEYRRRLTELEQAWTALEALPSTVVDEDFARTTIEMVAVAARARSAGRVGDAVDLGRRRTYWLAAARSGDRAWRHLWRRGCLRRAGTARWWPTCR